MSRTLPTDLALPLLGKLHPLTGQPIRAVAFRKNGLPIFPIMGGDATNDPPQRPDDVPQETWDALGDPGKTALTRERTARQDAERARDTAVRERDAARARPAPPAGGQGGQQGAGTGQPGQPGQSGGQGQQGAGTGQQQGGQPDIAAIVQQAVQAAIAPFQERETQRDTEAAAQRVRDAVLEAAKPLLHDPTDALANVDLTSVVDDQGRADAEKVTQALTRVVETKPHLARSTTRTAPFGIGGGAPASGATEGDRVKALLAEMQKSAGVRTAPAAS